MHLHRTVLALLLALLVTACGGGGGSGDPNVPPPGDPGNQPPEQPGETPPPDLGEPATRNTVAAINAVAKAIYDAQAEGRDMTPYIEAVFEALEVPVLGEDDAAPGGLADTRLNQGLPLISSTLAARVGDGFHDASLVPVPALVDYLAELGATVRFPYSTTNEPLTLDFFNNIIVPYMAHDYLEPEYEYTDEEALLAFVYALGRERVGRLGTGPTDPLWSDGNLDPLQLTILLYSGLMPAEEQALVAPIAKTTMAAAAATGGNPVRDYITDQLKSKLTGEVQKVLEIPLDQKDAAKVSVCASLLLYGHKVSVTNTPNLLRYSPSAPNVASVSVKVEFVDDYYDNYLKIDRWMLEKLGGCTLPRKGSTPYKPLTWSVSSGLQGHGNYDITPSQTDGVGEAVASWRTNTDKTPAACRVFRNQRDAVGATVVKVGNLVPGWSSLERIVSFLKDTGETGDAPLTVLYFDATEDPECHSL